MKHRNDQSMSQSLLSQLNKQFGDKTSRELLPWSFTIHKWFRLHHHIMPMLSLSYTTGSWKRGRQEKRGVHTQSLASRGRVWECGRCITMRQSSFQNTKQIVTWTSHQILQVKTMSRNAALLKKSSTIQSRYCDTGISYVMLTTEKLWSTFLVKK